MHPVKCFVYIELHLNIIKIKIEPKVNTVRNNIFCNIIHLFNKIDIHKKACNLLLYIISCKFQNCITLLLIILKFNLTEAVNL